jgi:hypothetical protein
MTKKEKAEIRQYLDRSLLLVNDLLFLLEKREVAQGVTDAELNKIAIWKPFLEAELVKIKGRLAALRAGSSGLTPPTNAQVERILDLTDEVDQMIDQQTATDAVITSATSVLTAIGSGADLPAVA